MESRGQYGIRNPLFMYQGTQGVSLQNELKTCAEVNGDLSNPSESGMSVELYPDQTQVVIYTATPPQIGAIRCGERL